MNLKHLLLLIPLSLLLPSCLDVDEPTVSSTMTITIGDQSFEMVYVKQGTFIMGATDTQAHYASNDEKPTHKVSLGAFYICKTEITAAVWNAVMKDSLPGANSSLPATGVSHERVTEFITLLNAQTGSFFALPTEAQWEYAARGGADSKNYLYAGSDEIKLVAVNDTDRIFPVARLTANSIGLYDMSGNVAEWCYDWYGKYSSADQNMPTGPSTGQYRVVRGGSFISAPDRCRVSARSYAAPDSASSTIGFRLILYPVN